MEIELFNKPKRTQRQESPMPTGITENITVIGFRDSTPDETVKTKENKKFFVLDIMHDSSGATYSESLYLTAAAEKYTRKKLEHMIKEANPGIDMDTIHNTKDIEAAIVGKTFRWFKLQKIEYKTKGGELKVRPGLGLPFFCQLAGEECKLRWDENNHYDYKRLSSTMPSPTPSLKADPVVVDEPVDDLPF